METHNQNDDNFFVKLAKSEKEKPKPSGDMEGQLTVDVYKDDEEIVVESTIAGVNPDEINIDITSDKVTIEGERHREREVEDEDYYYQECFWGSFSRSIILPEEVDPDESEAKFSKNGVLTIRMPMLKKTKSKKLEVKMD